MSEAPDPRPLHPVKYEVDPDVVNLLADALAAAKAGEIRAIAFACVRQGQETSSTFVSGHADNSIRLVGVVSRLLHRLQLQLDRSESRWER